MVFQDALAALNPTMTVGNQIMENLLPPHQAEQKRGQGTCRGAAAGWWESPSRRAGWTSIPHEFSGGMRQRVMIAIALCLRPQAAHRR